MTDSFVTQCPHCQTSFRVSHNQLSVARGAVRCGACLQVFNAARQLLEQSAAQQNPPIASMPVQAVIAPAATAARPVAISLRDWNSSNEVNLDTFEFDTAPRHDSLSARRDEPAHDEALWPDAVYIAPDEPGLAPEPEPGHLAERITPPLVAQEPPLTEHPLDDDRTEPSFTLEPATLAPTAGFASALARGESLHTDDDVPRKDRLSAVDHDDEESLPSQPPALPSVTRTKTRAQPALRHDPQLDDLLEDPPQYAWEKPVSRPGRRLMWTFMCLLAALGLGFQYLWYHFDELARQDQYRPLFEQFCPQLGCKVPSKVDIALIKSSNLVVRSHPDFSGALVVDAIIYNRASFSQPFPLLELRFADLNGSLIASRGFKPAEYLGGDLTGQAEMPPQTPIHISLDILDPGPKAVNYSLSFRSPE